MFNKKTYLGPPVDEITLHEQAKSIIENSDNLTISPLISSKEKDLALCALFHFIKKQNTSFIDLIDNQCLTNDSASRTTNINVKILIVPAFFYDEHPEIGGDGKLVEKIFNTNGFDASIIPVHSKGSVTTNSQIIATHIAENNDKLLWFVSISKGTADLRHCLQTMGRGIIPKNIAGWVNLSGIFQGSLLADVRSSSWLRRCFFRFVCRLLSVDYNLIAELTTDHPYWKADPKLFNGINLIHVVGFPLLSHVQHLLAHRYTKLSSIAPTDGMINLLETVQWPGKIYPMWGCDHFLRSTDVSLLLYKLCSYIHLQTQMEQNQCASQ